MWFEDRGGDKSTPVISYDGVRYVLIGKKVMCCHFGPDKHKVEKARLRENKDKQLQVNIRF